MKKSNLRSLIFVFVSILSVSSFIFLMSQRSVTNTFSDITIIEQTENAAKAHQGLPDAELLKAFVKQSKKYIFLN